MTIYVVVPNYGYNGYGVPIGAFSNKATALEYAALALRTSKAEDVEVLPYSLDWERPVA